MMEKALVKPGNPIVLGTYDALLFDMDGTILTSIAAVDRAWSAWANRAGLPASKVIAYVHGRTALDTMRHFLASTADVRAEARWLEDLELEDLDGVAEIPGAGVFLRSLPADRWAVVTSASYDLAMKRIGAAGLPTPSILVSSNDIVRGKPDPEGYLRAADSLRVRPEKCVVFEDTQAGMKAGFAAGAEVVQVVGTQPASDLPVRLTVDGYVGFSIKLDANSVRINVSR